MARWSIAGFWQGQYAYDAGEGYPDPAQSVQFVLELEQSWFGRFSGRVQDRGETGSPEPGQVKGRIWGLHLKFVKQMPIFYLRGRDGMTTFREYLKCDHSLVPDRNLRPPPVHYRGTFCPDSERVTGDWEIRPGVLRFTSDGRAYEWPLPGATGTWEMTR